MNERMKENLHVYNIIINQELLVKYDMNVPSHRHLKNLGH